MEDFEGEEKEGIAPSVGAWEVGGWMNKRIVPLDSGWFRAVYPSLRDARVADFAGEGGW